MSADPDNLPADIEALLPNGFVFPDKIGDEVIDQIGKTGIGAQVCYEKATMDLADMGITHPIGSNSVIAVNIHDHTIAWHAPTQGIDAWQQSCLNTLEVDAPGCDLEVVGPDWDVGGTSPMLIAIDDDDDHYSKKLTVISHNKGGQLFWINAKTGEIERRADVCRAGTAGGSQWGISYDPVSKNILMTCTGGNSTGIADVRNFYNSVLADGTEVCKTGYLNAIDVKTGDLKWQAVPARFRLTADEPDCNPDPNDPNDTTIREDENDIRFKFGIPYDKVIKNMVIPGVPVNYMPDNVNIPVGTLPLAQAIPSSSNGVVYWANFNGGVYGLDSHTGVPLNEMFCDVGGVYTGGPSTANGLVTFGCGWASGALGRSIMVYGLRNLDDDDTDSDDSSNSSSDDSSS